MGRSRIPGLPELSSHTYEGGHRPSESSACWGLPTGSAAKFATEQRIIAKTGLHLFPAPRELCHLRLIVNRTMVTDTRRKT